MNLVCTYEGAISGPLLLTRDVSTYTYNGDAGTTFTWSVVGGEVTAGQGTTSIEVTWGRMPVSAASLYWKATVQAARVKWCAR